MYNPQIGRWMAVDPLAEDYVSRSPYEGIGNNPVNFIDPDGRGWGALAEFFAAQIIIVGINLLSGDDPFEAFENSTLGLFTKEYKEYFGLTSQSNATVNMSRNTRKNEPSNRGWDACDDIGGIYIEYNSRLDKRTGKWIKSELYYKNGFLFNSVGNVIDPSNISDDFTKKTVDYLHSIASTKKGNLLLDKLSNANKKYIFKNITPTDNEGNEYKTTLRFRESDGIIEAGEFMNDNFSEFGKIEGAAHELFHCYQSDQGQGGSSIFNEFEAHLMGFSIAEDWAFETDYIGALSGTSFGTHTDAGRIYEEAFNSLLNSYSDENFIKGVNNFIKGYQKGYLYKDRPLRRRNQKKVLIKEFY